MGDPVVEKATMWVRGRVQGVGFRWWTRSRAKELGLVGYAKNLDDGRVEVGAQGPLEQILRLELLLSEHPSTARRPGRVESVVLQWGTVREDWSGFRER